MTISESHRAYLAGLKADLDLAYDLAQRARGKNRDPLTTVEIPQASDLASRVEGLVGPVDIAPRIRELTAQGLNREEVSIQVAREVAHAQREKGDSLEEAIDQAVRTGLAILTEGVLVAPLEGVAECKLYDNTDGSNFLSISFAGPIRAAGGTGQALSVLIADMVRRELGVGKYVATQDEIERFKEEFSLYRLLQHRPSNPEIEMIVSSLPVCVNGEGTEQVEVAGMRDLPRVETNKVRGGALLVIAEGMVLKAPKILKHVDKLEIDGWDFIRQFVKKSKGENKEEGPPKIKPSAKFIKDVIAGRPVFSHPSRPGGFRLRYRRCRTTGLAASSINPVTMEALDGFMAIATQIKIERPGKAGAITPCDTVEGPTLLLDNGDFVRVDDLPSWKKVADRVSEIWDVGEILLPFGEFAENNHRICPSNDCPEWWTQEVLANLEDHRALIKEKLGRLPHHEVDRVRHLEHMAVAEHVAWELARTLGIGLHSSYNFFWHDLEPEEYDRLVTDCAAAPISSGRLQLAADVDLKQILMKVGAFHRELDGQYLVASGLSFQRCLGERLPDESVMAAVNRAAGVRVREKAPSRIGARMGRPEKAKERSMSPPIHVLFPVGPPAGPQRLFSESMKAGKVDVGLGTRKCGTCGGRGVEMLCDCGGHREVMFGCRKCKTESDEAGPCPRCKEDMRGLISQEKVPVRERVTEAMKRLGPHFRLPKMKGVLGLSSNHKVPEPIEKGILRATHGLTVFRDGTVRFDMSDIPLTHFRPDEIGTSVEKLRELGYTHDCLGRPLERADQICELRIQDVIPSLSCGDFMLRTAKYLDDLLEHHYELDRFFHAQKVEDIVGQLAVGLAPHTSGGVLVRVVGFSDVNGCYGHPFFHASKRRNCDGDEDCLMLLLDGLINFSRQFLPKKRGSLMDVPLVLTTQIHPSEIDKEALNVDTRWFYPLQFYERTLDLPQPKEVLKENIVEIVEDRLGTPAQYEDIGYTHETTNIGTGPKVGSYTRLGSMIEKMDAQLSLGAKIRAVDEADVASRVIECHFLPDMYGNLRSFNRQAVRCTRCNHSYRRPPMTQKCVRPKGRFGDGPPCGGNLTLTIHHGSVVKYLKVALKMAEKYGIHIYERQRIEMLEEQVNSIFLNDKVTIKKLEDYMEW